MITKEKAIALIQSEFWKEMTPYEIVKFQLFENLLCMPLDIFHDAVEKVLQRPVWLHEFAFIDSLRKEFLGEKSAPTFEEIVKLLPEGIHDLAILLPKRNN